MLTINKSNVTFATTVSLILVFTISVFPWWVVYALSFGIGLAVLWHNKSPINWPMTRQFLKEFLGLGFTLIICTLWVWQLKLWLV